MKIERDIVSYDKTTENHVMDFLVEIDLNILKRIFQSNENDPLLYECYEIDREKAELMKKYITFDFDFDHFDYYLQAYSIE